MSIKVQEAAARNLGISAAGALNWEEGKPVEFGLTKLEHFAGLIAASLATSGSTYELAKNTEGAASDIAEAAVTIAEELCKTLSRRQ